MSRKRGELTAQVLELYQTVQDHNEIARQLGITRTDAVLEVLSRYGLHQPTIRRGMGSLPGAPPAAILIEAQYGDPRFVESSKDNVITAAPPIKRRTALAPMKGW